MTSKTTLQQVTTGLGIVILAILLPACATQSRTTANANIQSLLLQAGFKVRPATTPKQQQQLQNLPEHQFTTVSQQGQNFYVWADKPNNQLYCGDDQAYRNYEQIRRTQWERESGAITWLAGPRRIPVTVFRGWAPFREW